MSSIGIMNRRSQLLALLFGAERPFGAFGAPGDADCRWRVLRRARGEPSPEHVDGPATVAPAPVADVDPSPDASLEAREKSSAACSSQDDEAGAAEPAGWLAREPNRS
jgi:hypothetical protein